MPSGKSENSAKSMITAIVVNDGDDDSFVSLICAVVIKYVQRSEAIPNDHDPMQTKEIIKSSRFTITFPSVPRLSTTSITSPIYHHSLASEDSRTRKGVCLSLIRIIDDSKVCARVHAWNSNLAARS